MSRKCTNRETCSELDAGVELTEVIECIPDNMNDQSEEKGLDLNPDEDCIQGEVDLENNKNVIDKSSDSHEKSFLSTSSNHVPLTYSTCQESNGHAINIDKSSSDDKQRTLSRMSRTSVTSRAIPPPPLEESMCQVFFHILIPFLIAGCGTVGAGKVLDIVQYWRVYVEVPELFILVPSLLGLKGNLEMCLASRLSTHANLGTLDLPKEKWKVIGGNLALEQCQSTVVGFLASIVAIIMSVISQGKFDISHSLLLCASSITAASSTSLVLGSLMCTVVVISRKCKINPDNIATPVAASVGDLITLSILSGYSTLIYNAMKSFYWLPVILMCIYSLLMPLWIILAKRNRYVASILLTGWIPIISAMIISSGSGLLLSHAITVLKLGSIASFQPIINGIGGNLVAVQSSRLATGLHRSSELGKLPDDHPSICISPIKAFFSKELHAQTARLLILMSMPGQVLFMFAISALNGEVTSLTVSFGFLYISASTLQVIILLYMAVLLVHLLWRCKSDPDTSAIPYLTAIGDLLGTSLLICVVLINREIESTSASDSSGP